MFAKDRDLVAMEPGLLRDVAWSGQRRLITTGSVSGTTLTIGSGSFVDSGIAQGDIVSVDSTVVEVVEVLSATTATVSLVLGDGESDPIGPGAMTGVGVEVYTFRPQLGIVHRQVLAMLGIDPDDPQGLDASAVLNPESLVRLEALGALHLIYASAGAPGRGGEGFADRAARYRERFANERARVSVLIDLDGDGVAETRRHPNTFVLTRG